MVKTDYVSRTAPYTAFFIFVARQNERDTRGIGGVVTRLHTRSVQNTISKCKPFCNYQAEPPHYHGHNKRFRDTRYR